VAGSTESQEAEGLTEGQMIEVCRMIPASPDHVWELMTSPTGSAALLGDGAVLGSKGEPWRATAGPHGVVRSYHPLEQLRVSWHADEDAPASLVEMDLAPSGDGTQLVVRHERVAGGGSIDLREHWTTAVDRLAEAAAT
jgi:uncharacterized protein YndB with AHSA1/START domain